MHLDNIVLRDLHNINSKIRILLSRAVKRVMLSSSMICEMQVTAQKESALSG